MRKTVRRRIWLGAAAVALGVAGAWVVLPAGDAPATRAVRLVPSSLRPIPGASDVRYPPRFPETAPDATAAERPAGPCVAATPAVPGPPPGHAEVTRDPLVATPVARPDGVRGERERARELAKRAIRALTAGFERAREREAVCYQSGDCITAAYQAGRRAAVPSLETLAGLAASSRDPQVYASAIYACVLVDATVLSQACAALKPEQWAQLDPENALPWLYLASLASIRGDAATFDEAMLHAARSAYVVARQMPLFDALSGVPPSSEPVRAVMTERQFGAFGMYLLPDYASASTFCDVEAVVEPQRRRVCSDLADVLTEAGTTLRDLLVGIAIGNKVGWPQQRLAALRVDSARLQNADGPARLPARGPDCIVGDN